LVSQLGEGGFGSVWRGYDTRLDRHVAVKLLHAGVDVPRFKREAYALARLSHPNIVAAYDFGIDGATAYLVLELITGRTVGEELSAARAAGQTGLVLDRVLHLADQVLAGLSAAHSAGLIHRDLKPANVMVAAGGPETKIVDFGIARAGDASRMTAVGSVLGTLPYMAPEQFDDAPLDGRVDLYSLGCVLHELLTGGSPYQAKNTAAWIKAHHLQAPGHVRDRRPDVPAVVDAFIQRLLVKDPDGRPANAAAARALVVALTRLAGAAQPGPYVPPTESPMPATRAQVGSGEAGGSDAQTAHQMVLVCRKCGHVSPEGTQFCARQGCGEYLDWGTQVRTGIVSDTAAVTPGLYAQKSAASIRLSTSEVAVAPGAVATTTATVHNGGTQVEEFTMSVAGAVAAWATLEPATLRVYPGDQSECVVRFAPPPNSSAAAGKKTFTVSALSSVHRSLVASAQGTLDVGAFRELRATLVPMQSRGRGRTVHTIELTNNGNARETVRLTAADRTATLRFGLPGPEVRVSPGSVAIQMSVTSPRLVLGRPRHHQFQVTVASTNPSAPVAGQATPPAGAPAPVRLDGIRESLPLIPSWVTKLATALAALAIATVAVFALGTPGSTPHPAGSGLGTQPGGGQVIGPQPSTAKPSTSHPHTKPATTAPSSITVSSQPVKSAVAPPPPLGFLARLQGDWNLQSWTEATGPTTLYLDVRGGTMTVGGSGATDWRLDIDEHGETHSPQPAIKCGAQASDSATITGQPGGGRNASIDWTADLESVDHSSTGEGFIWRAMCGWTTIGGQYPFTVTLQGDPTQPATVLQMSNAYGTFVWQR
jgi:hypothetical protein